MSAPTEVQTRIRMSWFKRVVLSRISIPFLSTFKAPSRPPTTLPPSPDASQPLSTAAVVANTTTKSSKDAAITVKRSRNVFRRAAKKGDVIEKKDNVDTVREEVIAATTTPPFCQLLGNLSSTIEPPPMRVDTEHEVVPTHPQSPLQTDTNEPSAESTPSALLAETSSLPSAKDPVFATDSLFSIVPPSNGSEISSYQASVVDVDISGEKAISESTIVVIDLASPPADSRPLNPFFARSTAPLELELASTIRPSLDPLKTLPKEVSQMIFASLSTSDLARCSRISKKWNKSPTINYLWFQHCWREKFENQVETLPSGMWSKKESKSNWRTAYRDLIKQKERDPGFFYNATASTAQNSREDQWRTESQASKPNKVEMRELYKELGGRKSKMKMKIGGGRDRAGWGNEDDD